MSNEQAAELADASAAPADVAPTRTHIPADPPPLGRLAGPDTRTGDGRIADVVRSDKRAKLERQYEERLKRIEKAHRAGDEATRDIAVR